MSNVIIERHATSDNKYMLLALQQRQSFNHEQVGAQHAYEHSNE